MFGGDAVSEDAGLFLIKVEQQRLRLWRGHMGRLSQGLRI